MLGSGLVACNVPLCSIIVPCFSHGCTQFASSKVHCEESVRFVTTATAGTVDYIGLKKGKGSRTYV